MKLTIDRTKWLRGAGCEPSRLLRKEDGKMCCLGFYAKACGLTDDDIVGQPNPSGVNRALPDEMLWLFGQQNNSDECLRLMEENDSSEVSESKISEIFAKNGVEVEFVN